ncbi:hypothetical protein CQ022_00650 [Chryseobacterium culicis]|uniref:Uncharacterized protein n=1 Tax=Chryseobacterium culicis TaxID=680127 RepID=A0A2S9CWE0_CHRCI|nr:hypothetical protein CQ022_00650 [Chryseobacterium culicis]PRB87774.1 hypothetical protein CQ033_20225 [Chryseobacterium culicis]
MKATGFQDSVKNNLETNKNKMKQLHSIFNQYSRLFGQEPTGVACILDRGIVDKRCLYTWVS